MYQTFKLQTAAHEIWKNYYYEQIKRLIDVKASPLRFPFNKILLWYIIKETNTDNFGKTCYLYLDGHKVQVGMYALLYKNFTMYKKYITFIVQTNNVSESGKTQSKGTAPYKNKG